MKNGKCRMHGGGAIGPKIAEGGARIGAARTIHGGYGAAMRAVRANVPAIVTRGRVLRAVAETGLSLEALPALIDRLQGRTPCTVSGAALFERVLSPAQGRHLRRLIHEATSHPDSRDHGPTQSHGRTLYAVRVRERPKPDRSRAGHK